MRTHIKNFSKKMFTLIELIVSAVALFIIFVVLTVFLLFILLAVRGCDKIHNDGLKSTVEQIWDGPMTSTVPVNTDKE